MIPIVTVDDRHSECRYSMASSTENAPISSLSCAVLRTPVMKNLARLYCAFLLRSYVCIQNEQIIINFEIICYILVPQLTSLQDVSCKD